MNNGSALETFYAASGFTTMVGVVGATCETSELDFRCWRGVSKTHLHMNLDWKRDSFLQLLGFLIEVLAELSDGDSFLDGTYTWKNDI